MILAVWLLSLPFRLLAAPRLRRTVILVCLLVLAVTGYGVAEDLGVLEPLAWAAPACKPAARQPTPSQAAIADIPPQLSAALPLPLSVTYPLVGAGGHRQGRVRPRPSPPPASAQGATGLEPGAGCRSAVCRTARPATPGPATATAAPTTRPTPSQLPPGI